jgi:predicted HTH domain antitoxin
MTIELPDVRLGSQPLTSELARVDFAVGLYSGRHTSLGRAAKLAGMPVVLFMQELGRRGIFRNYTVDDALHDVARVRQKLGQ